MWVKNLAHAYTVGKKFSHSFLFSKVLKGANTCPHVSNISAPLKHFDCLLHWLELHNTMFQMISFSLASYNSRINPLLYRLCPYVYASIFTLLLPLFSFYHCIQHVLNLCSCLYLRQSYLKPTILTLFKKYLSWCNSQFWDLAHQTQ